MHDWVNKNMNFNLTRNEERFGKIFVQDERKEKNIVGITFLGLYPKVEQNITICEPLTNQDILR